jgi:hypothetical protein
VTEYAIENVKGANGTTRTNGSNGSNGAGRPGMTTGLNGTNGTKVADPDIDLREVETTRVRVRRDDNPFLALSPPERMKLIIRVLCEIVAYGEIDDEPAVQGPDQPAVNS